MNESRELFVFQSQIDLGLFEFLAEAKVVRAKLVDLVLHIAVTKNPVNFKVDRVYFKVDRVYFKIDCKTADLNRLFGVRTGAPPVILILSRDLIFNGIIFFYCANNRKMNQNGEHAAELCIAELKDRGCDFSLLFWLRNPEMLAGSPFGNDMIVFMEKDMKIDISQFDDGLFRGGFFQALRKEFNKSGLNPVSPQNYVEACGEGGKESALNKWRQERWPRPHQTFCFQTRAVTNSAFFIFQCWQAIIVFHVKRGLNRVNRFFS